MNKNSGGLGFDSSLFFISPVRSGMRGRPFKLASSPIWRGVFTKAYSFCVMPINQEKNIGQTSHLRSSRVSWPPSLNKKSNKMITTEEYVGAARRNAHLASDVVLSHDRALVLHL